MRTQYGDNGVSPNGGEHFSFAVSSGYKTTTSNFNFNHRANNYQTTGREYANFMNHQTNVQHYPPFGREPNLNSYSPAPIATSNRPQSDSYSRPTQTGGIHTTTMQQPGNTEVAMNYNSQTGEGGYSHGSNVENQHANPYNGDTVYAAMGVSTYRSTTDHISQGISQIRNTAVKYFSGQSDYNNNRHSYREFSNQHPERIVNSENFNANVGMKNTNIGNPLGPDYNNVNGGHSGDGYSAKYGQQPAMGGHKYSAYTLGTDQKNFKNHINNYGREYPNKENSQFPAGRPDYSDRNKNNGGNNYLNDHSHVFRTQPPNEQYQQPHTSSESLIQTPSPQFARFLPSSNLGDFSSEYSITRPLPDTKSHHHSLSGSPPSSSVSYSSSNRPQMPAIDSPERPSREHNRPVVTPSVNLPSSQHLPPKMPAPFFSHSPQSVPPEQQIQQSQPKLQPPPPPPPFHPVGSLVAPQPPLHHPNVDIHSSKGIFGVRGRESHSHKPNAIDDSFFQRLSKLMDSTLFYGDLDFKKHLQKRSVR